AASNLVTGDTNGDSDVFVTDTTTGTTTRVSTATGGAQGNDHSYEPTISADGRYIANATPSSKLGTGDTNTRSAVCVHDTSKATDGTQGNDPSYDPPISADGRYTAYTSPSSNLVTGDTNTRSDVFVHDTTTGTTTRVSTATGGAQGNGNSSEPKISADGRYI